MSRPVRSASRCPQSTILIVGVLSVLTLAAFLIRNPLYLRISGAAATSDMVGQLAAWVTEPGLIALVGLTAFLALWTWFRYRTAFWRLAFGGVGVILAYLASEAIKVLVAQERPCRALDVVTVLGCPESGDWSWPSNHSVIAAAFATACAAAVPRLLWVVAPAAVLIGLSRVAVGAHYLHDALAGLALGTAMVLFCVTALGTVFAHTGVKTSAARPPAG